MNHIELIVPIILYKKMSGKMLIEVLFILNGGKNVK